MEKPRKSVKAEFGRRLLNQLLMLKSSPKKIIRSSPIMTFLLFALTIFLPAKMSALEIVPETESAVVGSQTVFVLELPDSEPSKVEFINPSPMEEASVTGATKTAYAVENGGTGTRIELYIVFFKDGYFQLPNLQLHIDDLNYSVPFRPFQVYKNPSEIQPELFCEFENGVEGDFSAEAGKPIMFTVFARYFLQVASYSYEIPENALFRELEKFPAVSENQGRREFSAEKVPIARFEWTPLVQGTADLPAVHLDVTAYSGAKVALSLSDSQSIRVLPSSSEKKEVAKTESLFAYAFTPTGENSSDSEIAEPVSTEIRVLSRLRDKERRSLPFSNTRAVRREVESAMGLMPRRRRAFYHRADCALDFDGGRGNPYGHFFPPKTQRKIVCGVFFVHLPHRVRIGFHRPTARAIRRFHWRRSLSDTRKKRKNIVLHPRRKPRSHNGAHTGLALHRIQQHRRLGASKYGRADKIRRFRD